MRRSERHLIHPWPVVPLLIAGLLVLAGCGSSSEHPRAWIKGTVEAFILGGNPASCRVLITPHFAEQMTALRGRRAVRACEEEASRSDGDTETARVGKIHIHGTGAHVAVAIRGGDLNGQTVELRVVRAGGVWRLDGFTGIVRLDRVALLRIFAREYRRRGDSAAVRRCALRALRQASKRQIARYLFSGPADAIRPLYEGCRAEGSGRVIV